MIEALRQVTVKDTEGTVVDLSEFFGDVAKEEAEAEEAEETTEA